MRESLGMVNLGLLQPAAALSPAACCGERMGSESRALWSPLSPHIHPGPAGWHRKSGSRLPQSKPL
jgi:hypothetical protein